MEKEVEVTVKETSVICENCGNELGVYAIIEQFEYCPRCGAKWKEWE